MFFISMAAQMLGMHPQTLRKYERLGLVQPSRTMGSMRVYSREELERLRLIKYLVDELGINLAGVQRLLSIAEVVQRIRPLMDEGARVLGGKGEFAIITATLTASNLNKWRAVIEKRLLRALTAAHEAHAPIGFRPEPVRGDDEGRKNCSR